MDKTIWKKIPGLRTRYEAGDNGLIRRLSAPYETTFKGKPIVRMQPEKILCGTKLSTKGYVRVNIDGLTYSAHRLIALAFIPNSIGFAQINHKNGIKTDNRPSNLEWCTNQQNRDHAVANGLHPLGSQISKKLVEADILVIRALLNSGVSQKKIADAYGVCQQTISHIARGNTWRHL